MDTLQTRSSVTAKLAELDADEQAISTNRRSLHRRIDALYLNAPLENEQVTQLDQLEDEEQEISKRRHALHEQIDRLRAQLGLPRARARQRVDAA